MRFMDALSIRCKLSLSADRVQACAGDSHASSGIDIACPTTQNVLAIASPDELHGSSWPSSSIGTCSFCCNQQFSITAITTSTGAISERYAYTAYGQPTILDASGSILNASAISNRYTYTGREWDATLGLHHFRARWMSPSAGRFLSRDPIGYLGSPYGLYEYVKGGSLRRLDPFGLDGSTHVFCCGGKLIHSGDGIYRGCCNDVVYDSSTHCCENRKIVPKVSFWRCVSNDPDSFLGISGCWWDNSLGFLTCPFGIRARHSYVCCDGPDQNCFEVQKDGVLPTSGAPWGPKGPGKVPGSCNEDKVCPSAKEQNCKSCKTPYCFFPGPNCAWSSGNYGLTPGNWFW